VAHHHRESALAGKCVKGRMSKRGGSRQSHLSNPLVRGTTEFDEVLF
jgi:hypothetical protein